MREEVRAYLRPSRNLGCMKLNQYAASEIPTMQLICIYSKQSSHSNCITQFSNKIGECVTNQSNRSILTSHCLR